MQLQKIELQLTKPVTFLAGAKIASDGDLYLPITGESAVRAEAMNRKTLIGFVPSAIIKGTNKGTRWARRKQINRIGNRTTSVKAVMGLPDNIYVICAERCQLNDETKQSIKEKGSD